MQWQFLIKETKKERMPKYKRKDFAGKKKTATPKTDKRTAGWNRKPNSENLKVSIVIFCYKEKGRFVTPQDN